jgi:hypothetical protein
MVSLERSLKAGACARVTDVAGSLADDLQYDGVFVAVEEDLLDAKAVPGGFSLCPERIARAAEECGVA